MLRYQDQNNSPPGAKFPYKDPQTGTELSHTNLKGLKNQVKAHRQANGLPIGSNINAEIEDNSCREVLRKHPGYTGCVDDSGNPAGKTSWTLADVRRFVSFVLSWVAGGGKLVEQAEADSRADICIGCPHNVEVPGCLGCKGIASLVKSLLGNRKAKHHANLKTCGKCGCFLQAKVWAPKEALPKEDIDYPDFCWNRK